MKFLNKKTNIDFMGKRKIAFVKGGECSPAERRQPGTRDNQ